MPGVWEGSSTPVTCRPSGLQRQVWQGDILASGQGTAGLRLEVEGGKDGQRSGQS
jgi:hypothetical protein